MSEGRDAIPSSALLGSATYQERRSRRCIRGGTIPGCRSATERSWSLRARDPARGSAPSRTKRRRFPPGRSGAERPLSALAAAGRAGRKERAKKEGRKEAPPGPPRPAPDRRDGGAMALPRWRLLAVCEELGAGELAALKFLSLEHVPVRRLEGVGSARDFFQALQERGLLGAGDAAFLRELLYRIGRIDLLAAHLGSSREEMERELRVPGRARVSPYRQVTGLAALPP